MRMTLLTFDLLSESRTRLMCVLLEAVRQVSALPSASNNWQTMPAMRSFGCYFWKKLES